MKRKLIAMLIIASILLSMLPSLSFARQSNDIQPGDIVTAEDLKPGDEIVKGLGKYQYGTDPTSAAVQEISWIILDSAKTNTGIDGMFLISKNLLAKKVFDSDNDQTYQGSDIQQWLTGEFYDGTLKSVDEGLGNAIISTTKTDEEYTSQECHTRYNKVENILNGDKVFLPSTQEVDSDYAWKGEEGNEARIATGAAPESWWWLRSPVSDYGNCVGGVGDDGAVRSDYANDEYYGMRVSLNLNTDSLLFKSIEDGEYEVIDGIRIDFDTQGGSEVKSQIIEKGNMATEPESPAREGSTFKGWYDAEIGGSKIDFTSKTFDEDTTLYARWKHNVQPGEIVKADKLDPGDEIVAGLGKYKYGKDSGSSSVQDISWIILNPAKNNMGADGMYLISKNVLDNRVFDAGDQTYQGSDIQVWLKDTFYESALKDADAKLGNVIMPTTKTDEEYISQQYSGKYKKVENILNGDKVFLPSAQEVDNDYIWKGELSNDARIATGAANWWWLRSPSNDDGDVVGLVNNDGAVNLFNVNNSYGVRPALNINPQALLFKLVEEGKYEIVDTVDVTFDTQGGNDIDPQIIEKGGLATKPEDPTKDGYIFKGWYDKSEGGNAIDFATKTFGEDTIVYAQWTERSATLSYNNSGLSCATVPQNEIMKYSVEAKVARPTAPEGYIFEGWYDNADLTGEKISAGDIVKEANVVPTAITLYAKWRSILKFDANGGVMPEGMLGDIDMYRAGEVTIPEEEPTRAAHDFLGWAKDDKATQAEYAKGATYKEDGSYEPNATLYALWKAWDVRYAGSNRYDTSIKIADALKEQMEVESFDCIVVATGGNYPDALAAGYLASKNNAPLILISSSQESATAEYIKENLSDNGKIYLIGGVGAVSQMFEDMCKEIATEDNVTRLAGNDRYETNINILQEAGVQGEDILVCSGTGYADSLSASATGKPIFLVGKTLTEAQKEYLGTLNTSKYYAIGGTGAVSNKVFAEVCSIKPEAQKDRIGGANRYETSALVANEFFNTPDSEERYVVLAYAQNYPDGLAGSALGSALNAPVILTDNRRVGIEVAKGYVERAGATRSITLGGQGLISDESRDSIMGR